jgi:hypothetical protein
MFTTPYRTPERCTEALPADPLRNAQSVARLFLVGWSLLRVAVCSARGLDVEGFAAVVVLMGAVSSFTLAWSRFS